MNTREVILKQLAAIVTESSPVPFPAEVSDAMMLDEFWLDSLAFVQLLTRIEAELQCEPLTFFEGAEFPRTIGDLVKIYEEKAGSNGS